MPVSILQAAAGSPYEFGGDTHTMSYTLASGTNRLLLMFIGSGVSPTSIISGNQPTYAGIAMKGVGGATSLGSALWDADEGVWVRTACLYLLDADIAALGASANNFSFTNTAGQNAICGVLLQGVDQTTPFGTPQTQTGILQPSIAQTLTSDEMLIASLMSDDSVMGAINNGGTEFYRTTNIAGDTAFGAGYWTGAGSKTANWPASSADRNAMGAVIVRAANVVQKPLMINRYLKVDSGLSRSEWAS